MRSCFIFTKKKHCNNAGFEVSQLSINSDYEGIIKMKKKSITIAPILVTILLIGFVACTRNPQVEQKKPQIDSKKEALDGVVQNDDNQIIANVAGTKSNLGTQIVITNTIDTGFRPISMAISTDGNFLYVGNWAGEINIISIHSNTIVNTIQLEQAVFGLVESKDGQWLYAAISENSGTKESRIYKISLDTLTVDEPVSLYSEYAGKLIMSSDEKYLYMEDHANSGFPILKAEPFFAYDRITVYDSSGGEVMNQLAESPDGKRIYATAGTEVAVFDSSQSESIYTVGHIHMRSSFINGLAISPDSKTVYVTNGISDPNGTVEVIDAETNTVTASIDVGSEPNSIVTSLDGKFLYVINRYGDASLSVIDANAQEVIETIALGWNPSDIVLSPDGKEAYILHGYEVAGNDNGTISVLSGAIEGTKTEEVEMSFSPTPEIVKEVKHESILEGDFTCIAGKYKNGKGELITLGDDGRLVDRTGVESEVNKEIEIKRYREGYFEWGYDEGYFGGMLFPAGVKIPGVESDVTLDRVGIGQDVPLEDDVFYLDTVQ